MGQHRRVNAIRYLSRRRFIRVSASAAAGLAVGGCVAGRERLDNPGPRLVTTFGDLALPDTGVILPHEHIFLDPRFPSDSQQEPVQVEDVVEVMQPELQTLFERPCVHEEGSLMALHVGCGDVQPADLLPGGRH